MGLLLATHIIGMNVNLKHIPKARFSSLNISFRFTLHTFIFLQPGKRYSRTFIPLLLEISWCLMHVLFFESTFLHVSNTLPI